MTRENAVEVLIEDLKSRFASGSFGYDARNATWREVVYSIFPKSGPKTYGIYIIRKQHTNTILYIGRAGELDNTNRGQFKDQDLPKRLTNTRAKSAAANEWFKALVEKEGPIKVEYIVLNPPESPVSIKKSLIAAWDNDA